MNPNDKSEKGIKSLNNNNQSNITHALGRLIKSILSVA